MVCCGTVIERVGKYVCKRSGLEQVGIIIPNLVITWDHTREYPKHPNYRQKKKINQPTSYVYSVDSA